jgi:hypothetical protein
VSALLGGRVRVAKFKSTLASKLTSIVPLLAFPLVATLLPASAIAFLVGMVINVSTLLLGTLNARTVAGRMTLPTLLVLKCATVPLPGLVSIAQSAILTA